MVALRPDNPEFDGLVGEALEHLWDFSYLGKHQLAELQSIKSQFPQPNGLTHLDRGRALSDLLQSAIESLRPAKRQRDFSRERMFATILYRAYVEGVPSKQIAASLHIGERTMYRYKRKAVRVVAHLLHDWEMQG